MLGRNILDGHLGGLDNLLRLWLGLEHNHLWGLWSGRRGWGRLGADLCSKTATLAEDQSATWTLDEGGRGRELVLGEGLLLHNHWSWSGHWGWAWGGRRCGCRSWCRCSGWSWRLGLLVVLVLVGAVVVVVLLLVGLLLEANHLDLALGGSLGGCRRGRRGGGHRLGSLHSDLLEDGLHSQALVGQEANLLGLLLEDDLLLGLLGLLEDNLLLWLLWLLWLALDLNLLLLRGNGIDALELEVWRLNLWLQWHLNQLGLRLWGWSDQVHLLLLLNNTAWALEGAQVDLGSSLDGASLDGDRLLRGWLLDADQLRLLNLNQLGLRGLRLLLLDDLDNLLLLLWGLGSELGLGQLQHLLLLQSRLLNTDELGLGLWLGCLLDHLNLLGLLLLDHLDDLLLWDFGGESWLWQLDLLLLLLLLGLLDSDELWLGLGLLNNLHLLGLLDLLDELLLGLLDSDQLRLLLLDDLNLLLWQLGLELGLGQLQESLLLGLLLESD